MTRLRNLERKVVDLARRKADAVVVSARDKADHDSGPSTASEQAVVGNDRAQADEILLGERATADARLRREREASSYAFAGSPAVGERPHRQRPADRTQQLRRGDCQSGRLPRIVSHDLRNLLAGIVLSSSLLSKRASDTDEGKRIVVTGKRIQLYAARMNRLIGDLVDVVSIDAGHLACAIESSDPLALIAETLETFRRAAEDKDVLFQSKIVGTLPWAAFDYERAASGVCQPHLERAQVQSIVEAHGGRIWVGSKVGEGCLFHSMVPIVARAHCH